MKSELEIIESHIKSGKPEQFIRNCLSCCGVKFIEAVENNCINIVKFMIDRGVNFRTDENSPMRKAVAYGHLEIVKLLFNYGAKVDEDSDDLCICFASMNGSLEIVKLLLKKGANIHSNNDYAFRLACTNGHLEVVKFLVSEGADINCNVKTCLGEALRKKNFEIAKFLLDSGYNVGKRSLKNLIIYCENFKEYKEYTEIIEVLEKHYEQL